VKHYLVLTWAEEPDTGGTWSSILDWQITHSPDCPVEIVQVPWGTVCDHTCVFEWEASEVGVEAFGTPEARADIFGGDTPRIVAIAHHVEKYASGEVDAFIIPDPDANGDPIPMAVEAWEGE